MTTSPETLARLLKNSTLDAAEQLAILNLLPSLTEPQRAELTNILETDNKNQSIALQTALSKRDETLLKFKMDMQKVESENHVSSVTPD